MRRKGMFFGFLLLLILASSAFVISQLTVVDKNQLKGDWEIFQEKVMDENSFIKTIDINGNRQSFFIHFTITNEMSDQEIENLFCETKMFLFQEDVFQRLVQYHHDNYGGGMYNIYIVFTHHGNSNEKYRTFFSSSDSTGEPDVDSFKEWYVDIDDTTIKYVEKE